MKVFIHILLLVILFSETSFALPEIGQKVMVTSTSREASQAGLEIARKGGNAVDIAIATMLALAVTRPYYAALGGGGFALVHMGDKTEALDFRETAPRATSESFYIGKPSKVSQDGGAAVGVPGMPAGLWDLQKKYGRLHWSELFQPAIKLAAEGFTISGDWSQITKDNKDRFNPAGKNVFLKKSGEPYLPGDKLVQPGLAKLLKEMRTRGVAPFYSGMQARDIVEAVKSAGGVMDLEDLKSYKVRWLAPLQTKYEGHDIYLMPPPSSGGIVIATALGLMERISIKEKAPLSVDELHLFGEVLARSFRGRSLLGDPDFYKNPLTNLLSPAYLDKLAKSISLKDVKHLDPLTEENLAKETQTTHLSVMTANGDAVSMTITLNGPYGSAVVTPYYGIALNNEMDDFTTHPGEPNFFGLIQGRANAVQPGKRPLSSMSPTLVMKDGKTVMSVGSPGGPRIISAVLQVLYRVIVNNWDMDRAIQTPRVHHQFLPRKLFAEPTGLAPETLEGLRKRGHEVVQDWPNAKVYGVRVNKQGLLEGAFDARGEGGAFGY